MITSISKSFNCSYIQKKNPIHILSFPSIRFYHKIDKDPPKILYKSRIIPCAPYTILILANHTRAQPTKSRSV